MSIAILNGEFVERNQAKVDIEDRGYQFGDGIYEVIRVYNGRMFASQMHLDRLLECAEKINLILPLSISEIEQKLATLIEKNQLDSGIVYLQFSRGVAARNHAFPAPTTVASFVAYTKKLDRPIKTIKHGARAILVEDIRWHHCDIKSLNLLGNLLAKQKAVESGCEEAVLHRGQNITEGSSSNISIIKNGVLYTHPADQYILNGITRQVMLSLCKNLNLQYEERVFSVEELLAADEVIQTSTTAEITPIVAVSDRVIGTGEPGDFTVRLGELFELEIIRQCGAV